MPSVPGGWRGGGFGQTIRNAVDPAECEDLRLQVARWEQGVSNKEKVRHTKMPFIQMFRSVANHTKAEPNRKTNQEIVFEIKMSREMAKLT